MFNCFMWIIVGLVVAILLFAYWGDRYVPYLDDYDAHDPYGDR